MTNHWSFEPTRGLLAGAVLVCALFLPACGDDGAAAAGNTVLDTRLDPARNVVVASPTPFAPAYGGIGVGKISLATGQRLPTTDIQLSEIALRDAGEDKCGQFVPDYQKGVEITLAATLAPGTYEVVSESALDAGKVRVLFGNNGWVSGKLTIEEGNETRGSAVRGRLEAKTVDGASLELSFETLFHGCGRS